MRGLILAAGLLLALPAAAGVAPLTPKAVVEAERAFAADGAALGIKQSFLKWMADDALVFNPDLARARPLYESRPDRKGPLLEWWPVWAGIARSGDLGFTTGPYTVNGKPGAFYFTVWKKQPDGTWKWIFDGGADADPKGAPGKGAVPAYLAPSRQPGRYPEGAEAELAKVEAALAERADKDAVAGYRAVLACDGRLYTEGRPPAIGCGQFDAALEARPHQMFLQPLGVVMSASGDLAFTHGGASWGQGPAFRRANYARIWQRRAEGWKLVFDELVLAPPPPPPPLVG
jgi:ketosteroid isomerase-like protein